MTEMHKPPHSGEVLREWLSEISVTEAAKRLGDTFGPRFDRLQRNRLLTLKKLTLGMPGSAKSA